jgi:di/tricarboxylate transporter
MGLMKRSSWILAAVFVSVCGFRVTSGVHGIDITVTALFGSAVLPAAQVGGRNGERARFGTFVWYGGLLRLGKAQTMRA